MNYSLEMQCFDLISWHHVYNLNFSLCNDKCQIYYLCISTAAAHGSAQEDVHQQHDQEEYAQGDGQPQQPTGSYAILAIARDYCLDTIK